MKGDHVPKYNIAIMSTDLVVHCVFESLLVGKLDNSVAGAGHVYVGIGDVAGGAEKVLKVLEEKNRI
jgi:hypothetical protein